MTLPRTGDVLVIGPRASVQFSRPFRFRVIRVDLRSSCEGWIWIEGYQLGRDGQATERRNLFVQLAGLTRASRPD